MNILKHTAAALFLSAALFFNLNADAQVAAAPALPKNWHQMDLKTGGYFGVSLNSA